MNFFTLARLRNRTLSLALACLSAQSISAGNDYFAPTLPPPGTNALQKPLRSKPSALEPVRDGKAVATIVVAKATR